MVDLTVTVALLSNGIYVKHNRVLVLLTFAMGLSDHSKKALGITQTLQHSPYHDQYMHNLQSMVGYIC